VTDHLPFSPGGTTPPVTPPILGGSRSPPTPPAPAVKDEADRDGQAHPPADGAVGRHPRKQVTKHRPADVQALGPALCRGPLLGLRAGVVAAAHLTRLAAPLTARAPRTAS